ncbi:hypothetical protein Tco_1063882 [Tanacetum coccineum]
MRYTREWKEAKNFVTFSFLEENDNEDVEVKECGVTLICDEDIQEADLSMLQGLPTPTQHGGMLRLYSGVNDNSKQGVKCEPVGDCIIYIAITKPLYCRRWSTIWSNLLNPTSNDRDGSCSLMDTVPTWDVDLVFVVVHGGGGEGNNNKLGCGLGLRWMV